MIVQIDCSLGQFNIASNKKDWMLVVRTPHGNVREFFDEEPYNWSGCIENALDLIEARMAEYWFRSDNEKDRATIAAIRENLNACELAYAEGRLAIAENKAKQAADEVEAIRRAIASLRNEISGSAVGVV